MNDLWVDNARKVAKGIWGGFGDYIGGRGFSFGVNFMRAVVAAVTAGLGVSLLVAGERRIKV